MPQLNEDMYCSQQICIPPTFPYLLRQYAKAAIRTQPLDLLRWSTAYFRCLALNLPAPVKPRLEYPIPKTHFGLTPGWLKTLLHQLQNNLTVSFKILWDRWIGACLQHENLIEILCLSGFTDPNAIPWFRFIALCAAHLTENLTQSMILICEILTEEPEGGSAMIPIEVFLDVYKFIGAIDASRPQTILNLYFTDSLLSLYREPSLVISKESTIEMEEEIEEEEVASEEEKVEEMDLGPTEDLIGVVISCPDIAVDNYKGEEDFLKEAKDRQSTEYKTTVVPPEVLALENVDLEEERKQKAAIAISKTEGSVDTLVNYQPERQVAEYLEQVQEGEQEEGEKVREEIDYELKQLKEMLEMAPNVQESKSVTIVSEESETKREDSEEEIEDREGIEQGEEGVEQETPAKKGNCVYIEAIPGIGPPVPTKLVEAVIKYMKECAAVQHGTVMPRNVCHFNCPPLEIQSV